MTHTVTLNGNVYRDDATPPNNMDDGGFRDNLMPMLADAVVDLAAKQAAAAASVTSASAQATAAAASAASAAAAPGTNATSTTSLSVAAGAQTLTIQTGKSIVVGAHVQVARTSDATKWMNGPVTAYNSGTGVLSFTASNFAPAAGAGPYTDWTVSLSGVPGVTGTLNEQFAADVASAATTSDIWSGIGNTMNFTGNATVTALPAAPNAGAKRTLLVTGTPTLTNGANFVIKGGSMVCAAGDEIDVEAETTTKFRISVRKASGLPSASNPTGATATNPMSGNAVLTYASNQLQVLYPNAANLAVKMEDAQTVPLLGYVRTHKNRGSFPLQILDFGSNLIGWIMPGACVDMYLEAAGSQNGTWLIQTGSKNSDVGFYDWGCSLSYGSAAGFSLNNTAGMSSQMLDAELGLVMFYSVAGGIQPAAVRVKDGGIQNGAVGTAITTTSGYLSMCQNGAAEVVALLPQNPIKAISYVVNTSTLALTSQTAVTKAAVATATTNLDYQASGNLFYTYTETTSNKAWCGSLTGNGAGITFNTAIQLSATTGMKSSKIAALSSALSHQIAWDGSTLYASRATWSGTTPTPGAQTTVASRQWIANYVDAMEIVRTSATVSLAVYGGVDSNSNNTSSSIYANVITDTGSGITTSETRLVDGFSAALVNGAKMQFVNAQKGVGGSINVICSDGTSLKQATVRLVGGVPVISAFTEKQLPGPLWTGSSGSRYDNCVPTSMRGVSGSYIFPIPVWAGSTILAQDFQTANTNLASIVYQPQCIAPQ